LPLEFFARIIWQESRFKADAVGPLTRTGQRAQGIAQFMPVTAAERLLHDPFDPPEALRKSAAFLRELQDQFGNPGLAAAAYNAGPQWIRDWLTGKRSLPSETDLCPESNRSFRAAMGSARTTLDARAPPANVMH
jgi:soluble lytic murein transglycosylase-like protein